MEDRCRFASEVVRAIRDAVGPDYLVLYRISPEEEEPHGYSVNEAVELLQQIVPLGIDVVHVSSWEYGAGVRDDYPAGSHPTRVIRDALPPEKPVIGVGGIVHPDRALKVLEDHVELVALGKALLMDADWVGKVIAGQVDSIQSEIPSRAVLDGLDVPPLMKEYLARFFLADGN
jgi:2,4-dienoyl-CoA reductase-like NADH-dependent reductase (Old Yellow Enzyme family)